MKIITTRLGYYVYDKKLSEAIINLLKKLI